MSGTQEKEKSDKIEERCEWNKEKNTAIEANPQKGQVLEVSDVDFNYD